MATSPAAEQQSAVEEKVLALVSEKKPVRTTELMNVAREHDLSPADVREAVWTLLDDGRLDLTADRHLTVR